MSNPIDLTAMHYPHDVTYYPYRTARAINQYISIARNSDVGIYLENLLNKDAGLKYTTNFKDNHCTYVIKNKLTNEIAMAITISDTNIIIGTDVVVEDWP